MYYDLQCTREECLTFSSLLYLDDKQFANRKERVFFCAWFNRAWRFKIRYSVFQILTSSEFPLSFSEKISCKMCFATWLEQNTSNIFIHSQIGVCSVELKENTCLMPTPYQTIGILARKATMDRCRKIIRIDLLSLWPNVQLGSH